MVVVSDYHNIFRSRGNRITAMITNEILSLSRRSVAISTQSLSLPDINNRGDCDLMPLASQLSGDDDLPILQSGRKSGGVQDLPATDRDLERMLDMSDRTERCRDCYD